MRRLMLFLLSFFVAIQISAPAFGGNAFSKILGGNAFPKIYTLTPSSTIEYMRIALDNDKYDYENFKNELWSNDKSRSITIVNIKKKVALLFHVDSGNEKRTTCFLSMNQDGFYRVPLRSIERTIDLDKAPEDVKMGWYAKISESLEANGSFKGLILFENGNAFKVKYWLLKDDVGYLNYDAKFLKKGQYNPRNFKNIVNYTGTVSVTQYSKKYVKFLLQ